MMSILGGFLVLLGLYLLYVCYLFTGIHEADYNRHKEYLKTKSSDIFSRTKLLLEKSHEHSS